MTKKIQFLFAFLIISALVFSACTPTATEPEVVVEEEAAAPEAEEEMEAEEEAVEEVVEEAAPMAAWDDGEEVVSYGYSTTDIPDLDPQVSEDSVSITYIENLFVHLTNYDLETAEVVPEAATAWETSDDGLVWPFTIRTDIPWVKYDAATGEVSQVEDALAAARVAHQVGPASSMVSSALVILTPVLTTVPLLLLKSKAVMMYCTLKIPKQSLLN